MSVQQSSAAGELVLVGSHTKLPANSNLARWDTFQVSMSSRRTFLCLPERIRQYSLRAQHEEAPEEYGYLPFCRECRNDPFRGN